MAIEPIPVDALPDDLQVALSERARAQGQIPSEYVLGLIRRDLDVLSWSDWLRSLSYDEPVEAASASDDLALGRERRAAQLLGATTGEDKP